MHVYIAHVYNLDLPSRVPLASLCFALQSITKLLLDIVGVAENNGLKLPREFGMLIK